MRYDMCSIDMRLLSFWRRSVFVVLLASFALAVHAQPKRPMQRSGRDFSFGIIEGSELLPGAPLGSFHLTLTILAANDTIKEGCGTITSPGGYAQDFSFSGKQPTVINLPQSLLHLNDLGKTQKGLVVHTNEPVSLTLHDYMESAGDATQIYPNSALDTDYFCPGWGLWDDNVGGTPENNHAQVLVTASQNNTTVTITPTVQTSAGDPPNVPINITLNAGECYILKTDTSHGGVAAGLSGTTVLSSKPVSVIVGVTCAYVPLAMQSCNEMMDEIQGRSHWSDHYYISPLGNADTSGDVRAILTSDRPFFFTVNGSPGSALSGRFTLPFNGAAEINTFGVKCELHEMAVGSTAAYLGLSDPTLVTVLDSNDWTDTVFWNTPHFVPRDTSFFDNWVSLVYPTTADNVAKLDNIPLSTYPGRQVINGSGMTSLVIGVSEGRHIITSPVPFAATATGFALADAYTFIPANTAPYVKRDTSRHTISVTMDSAMACHGFGATYSVEPPFDAAEHVMSVTVTIQLDPTYTPLVQFEKHLTGENVFWSVDSSHPGLLTINIIGDPAIIGSDLFRVLFRAARKESLALLSHGATACADNVEILTTTPALFTIAASTDTLRHALEFDSIPAIICKPYVLSLLTDSIVGAGEPFLPDSIDITFDTTVFQFTSATLGKLLKGIPVTVSGGANGHYTIKVNSLSNASGSDSLLTLTLLPRIGAQNAQIHARLFYHVCEDMHTKDVTIVKNVTPNIDTTTTRLTVSAASVSFGNHAFAPLQLTGLPIAASVTRFSLYVTYDHGLLSLIAPSLNGTLAAGWNATVRTGASRDTIDFTSPGPPLGIAGTLANLVFETFVADTTASPIVVTSSLPAAVGGCQVLYDSRPALTNFIGTNLCGDSIMRSFMLTGQLLIERIEQLSATELRMLLNSPDAQDVTVSLSDVLGNTIQSNTEHVTVGKQQMNIDLGNLPSGAYLIEVQTRAGRVTRKIVIIR